MAARQAQRTHSIPPSIAIITLNYFLCTSFFFFFSIPVCILLPRRLTSPPPRCHYAIPHFFCAHSLPRHLPRSSVCCMPARGYLVSICLTRYMITYSRSIVPRAAALPPFCVRHHTMQARGTDLFGRRRSLHHFTTAVPCWRQTAQTLRSLFPGTGLQPPKRVDPCKKNIQLQQLSTPPWSCKINIPHSVRIPSRFAWARVFPKPQEKVLIPPSTIDMVKSRAQSHRRGVPLIRAVSSCRFAPCRDCFVAVS